MVTKKGPYNAEELHQSPLNLLVLRVASFPFELNTGKATKDLVSPPTCLWPAWEVIRKCVTSDLQVNEWVSCWLCSVCSVALAFYGNISILLYLFILGGKGWSHCFKEESHKEIGRVFFWLYTFFLYSSGADNVITISNIIIIDFYHYNFSKMIMWKITIIL